MHVFIAVQCTVKTHGGRGACKYRSGCELVVNVSLQAAGDHSSGERRQEKKDQQSSLNL